MVVTGSGGCGDSDGGGDGGNSGDGIGHSYAAAWQKLSRPYT